MHQKETTYSREEINRGSFSINSWAASRRSLSPHVDLPAPTISASPSTGWTLAGEGRGAVRVWDPLWDYRGYRSLKHMISFNYL
jgi:hypothetical protein